SGPHPFYTIKTAAIFIQSAFRGMMVRKQIAERHKSAKMIQKTYRAYKQRRDYLTLRNATIHVQQQKHKAASVIQAMYKMYRTRVPFQAMKLAALVIQRQYRCHLLRKEVRENFLKLRCSAIAIQAVYRGNRLRRDIAR
uniref:Calmodulin binding transcription activator 2 n=1 Tax=Sinocyclocheilus anshuiensis TaxID=1608454 RepID=A0A671K0W1_9TELE